MGPSGEEEDGAQSPFSWCDEEDETKESWWSWSSRSLNRGEEAEDGKGDGSRLGSLRRVVEKQWLAGERRGIVIAFCGCIATVPDYWLMPIMLSVCGNVTRIIFWQLALTSFIVWACVSLEARHESNWQRLASNLTDDAAWMVVMGLSAAAMTVGIVALYTLELSAASLAWVFVHPILAYIGSSWLGDTLPRRTAAALAVASVCLVFTAHPVTMSLAGSFVALATGFAVALFLVVVRDSFKRGKDLNVPAAVAIGHLFASAIAAILAMFVFDASLLFAGRDVSRTFFPAAVAAACMNSILLIAFSWAPKYITSAHVGLASLLNRFICSQFGDQVLAAKAGATIIIIVLLVHETCAAVLGDVPESTVAPPPPLKDKLPGEQARNDDAPTKETPPLPPDA